MPAQAGPLAEGRASSNAGTLRSDILRQVTVKGASQQAFQGRRVSRSGWGRDALTTPGSSEEGILTSLALVPKTVRGELVEGQAIQYLHYFWLKG